MQKNIDETQIESALFTRNRCLRDWIRKKSFHFSFNDKEDDSFVLLRDGLYNCWNQRSFIKMEGSINFRIENSWISGWLIEDKLTTNPDWNEANLIEDCRLIFVNCAYNIYIYTMEFDWIDGVTELRGLNYVWRKKRRFIVVKSFIDNEIKRMGKNEWEKFAGI